MNSQGVVINDAFQTKCTTVASVGLAEKAASQIHSIPGKEVLTFSVDDIHYVEMLPGTYYDFSKYDYFSENGIDPKNQGWQLAHEEESGMYNSWSNIGDIPDQLYDENGFDISNLIEDMHDSIAIIQAEENVPYRRPMYFFDRLNAEEQIKIRETRIGYCEFTIALPKFALQRKPNYYFTDIDYDSSELPVKPDFFRDNSGEYSKYESLKTFISFGLVAGENIANFRFTILFKIYYNWTLRSYEVYFYTEPSASGQRPTSESMIKIEGWDGQSLMTFKSEYAPNTAGDVKCNLLLKEGDNWRTLATDLSPTFEPTFNPNSSQFGGYSSGTRTNLAIQNFRFRAYNNGDYRVLLDDELFQGVDAYLNHCKALYTYRIAGTDPAAQVDWFYNKNNQVNLYNGTVTIYDNHFSINNINNYKYFGNKEKTITVTANTGSITEFNNPNKRIYKLNVKENANLRRLNVANNNLAALDLSENTKLIDIDLSNNPALTDIIFPKKWANNEQINLNCSGLSLERFELADESSTRVRMNIVMPDITKIKTLILRNINITNIAELISNVYSSVEVIDITGSNILTNKANLTTFLENLPDRKDLTPGIIYLYGDKYTASSVKGSAKAIAEQLEQLRQKNWLFYL